MILGWCSTLPPRGATTVHSSVSRHEESRLGACRRWVGHVWKVQLSRHTGFLAATSIQGTHTKEAKFRHARIAEVKQSSIPSLQLFKVPKLWSWACTYLRHQGHRVTSAINHRKDSGMEDTKPLLSPLSTSHLGAEATKPWQKVLRALQKGLSLPVCKHQGTTKL